MNYLLGSVAIYVAFGLLLLRVCARDHPNADLADFCVGLAHFEPAAIVMFVFFLIFWPFFLVIGLATVAIERIRSENPSPR